MSGPVDIVAVLRADTLAQVFVNARPLAGEFEEFADLMEHPLEDNTVVTDHKVQQPVNITLPLVLAGPTARDTFEEIRQLWRDGTLLIVQSRAAEYPSMVLVAPPHGESSETGDVLTVQIRLREAKFVKAVYGGLAPAKVKDKTKASTAKRGTQQTTKTPPAKAGPAGAQVKDSTLYKWFGGKK